MENSFCVISKPYPIIGGFSFILQRIEIVREICDGKEKRFQTLSPSIVKLCRLCILDICKELLAKINWETTRYKKYTLLLNKLETNSYELLIENESEFILDLKDNIIDCKTLYNKYHSLYLNLQQVKLYSKECIICLETKAPMLEYNF
jgi:CRISPR/Cas system endoribonuclease Cas6 (RAMP superfamily)